MSMSFAGKSTCPADRRPRLHVAVCTAEPQDPPDPARGPAWARRLLALADAAPGLGIGTLSVRVPQVGAAAAAEFLDRAADDLRRRGVRVTALGRRECFPAALRRAVGTVERATAGGRRLHLRLAFGASSRDAIVAAFQGWDDRPPRTRAEVSWLLGADGPPGVPVPDVDVLLLAGGTPRLDDFLLWECAHAEVRIVAADLAELRTSDLAAALGVRRPGRDASRRGARRAARRAACARVRP